MARSREIFCVIFCTLMHHRCKYNCLLVMLSLSSYLNVTYLLRHFYFLGCISSLVIHSSPSLFHSQLKAVTFLQFLCYRLHKLSTSEPYFSFLVFFVIFSFISGSRLSWLIRRAQSQCVYCHWWAGVVRQLGDIFSSYLLFTKRFDKARSEIAATW